MSNYLPASRWSQALNFTEPELNAYLEELGYQTRITSGGNTRWSITSHGQAYGHMSRNPFRPVPLWNFQAFFQAVKLRGRKTGQYYYCEECGDYLSDQYGFEFSMNKWVCKKCGVVNELNYTPPGDYEKAEDSGQMETITQICPRCGKNAEGLDEINVVFGLEKDISGHVVPKVVCKKCRGKELFSYGKK